APEARLLAVGWRTRACEDPRMNPGSPSSSRADLLAVLDQVHDHVRPLIGQGKVASYIPGLANVPIDRFGMAVATLDGEMIGIGDADEKFSIQSISTVFTLTLALEALGGELWKRVGREPSGNA